jgi:N-acetylglutamate synthase-like GNAT family acetyltransferase
LIRKARHEDIEAMVTLGRAMHAESIFAPYDYDQAKVALHIGTLIELPNGIALVAEGDGGIHGGFIGAVEPHYFGTDTQAFDYALFLTPRARTGSTGLKLIREYVKQAKHIGAKQIMLANSTGYQPERVARLFESMGFNRLGFVFELQ